MTTFSRRLGRGPVPPRPEPLAPSGIPAPLATASQDELRERRRRRQPVHLRENYLQSAEVRAVCRSLGVDISRLPNPLAMRPDIEAILDACHELMHTEVGLIAESRDPSIDQARTRQAVADLAVRPQAITVTDNQVISGSWIQTLTDWLAPYDGDLASVLGRALPPDAPGLRGAPSASERIERALRHLDQAVLAAERRLPKVRQRQQLPSMAEYNAELKAKADAERQQRALAKLGVGAV